MRYFLILTLYLLTAFPVFAQDNSVQDTSVKNESENVLDPATFEQRYTLAQQLAEVRPVKNQVDAAIEKYVQLRIPEQMRDAYRNGLRKILNYSAIEKISIDAYTDTFTEAELQAMVDYYSKPEAKSANRKIEDYATKVFPEVSRMLDQALMRLKTGGEVAPN